MSDDDEEQLQCGATATSVSLSIISLLIKTWQEPRLCGFRSSLALCASSKSNSNNAPATVASCNYLHARFTANAGRAHWAVRERSTITAYADGASLLATQTLLVLIVTVQGEDLK
jgi:hypothetical protein